MWLLGIAILTAILAGLVAFASATQASELVFLEVSQPFFQPNGGLEIHRVTYATWMGSVQPGTEIRYLAEANYTMQTGGRPPLLDSTSFDQNVASHLHVRVNVEDRSATSTWKQIGVRRNAPNPALNGPIMGVDTLAVDIDLSESVKILAQERTTTDLGSMVSIEHLARELVACIRDNASRSKPPIRCVRIRFHGAPEAKRHDGVHRVPSP